MRKHQGICILAILCSAVALVAQPAVEEGGERGITVYAYDSFCGEWGPGPVVVPAFEKKTGIKVNLVSAGDGGEMLTKLISEKERPVADVVVGISDSLASRVWEADILEPYHSPALADIPPFLQFDSQSRLLPFDYGNFAFVCDTEKLSEPMIPHSLDDLRKPEYRKKVILVDPRTSSVGFGLLLWTIEVYGEEGYLAWWKAMKENALTFADGWSSAYGLFTEGEAPLVISYTTSPVYHVMFENSTRYRTLLFDEGHGTTIEGVGIVKGTKRRSECEAFIDFLLTDAQMDIATSNSMYPANLSLSLPPAFDYAPKPERNLTMDAKTIEKNQERWLTEWERAMSR